MTENNRSILQYLLYSQLYFSFKFSRNQPCIGIFNKTWILVDSLAFFLNKRQTAKTIYWWNVSELVNLSKGEDVVEKE